MEVSGQLHPRVALPPGERAPFYVYTLYRRLGGARIGLDTVEKTTASVGNRSTVVRPQLVTTVTVLSRLPLILESVWVKYLYIRRLKWVGKADFVLNQTSRYEDVWRRDKHSRILNLGVRLDEWPAAHPATLSYHHYYYYYYYYW
jgi:hypothetical protein